MTDTRLKECIEQWPECREGTYNPRCCRFPKSCSCGGAPESAEPPEPPNAMWMPLPLGADLFYQCHLNWFGHRTTGISRDKGTALAYALEELAAKVRGGGIKL